jgi:hypothetical protein
VTQAARINPQELLLGAATNQVAQISLPVIDAGSGDHAQPRDGGRRFEIEQGFLFARRRGRQQGAFGRKHIDVQGWEFISGLEIDELRPNRELQ